MNRQETLELLNKYGRIASTDAFQPTEEELIALWGAAEAKVEKGWQAGIWFVVMKGKEIAGSRVSLWNRFYDRQHVLLPQN